MQKLAYSVVEAAEVLGISKSQTYRAINDGTLPVVMIGHRKLVPADELAAFVKRLSATSTVKERVDTDEA